ncbi:MAG TPA: FG-GAP-like repeat-containing protein, partial [Oligoflexus sp.]|uniref:FG-GAP-like repeat-containing protein n=1 Tax=Oligoflexus sp. TaxID=1971216 RepID=UPI002D42BBE0
MIQRVRFWTYFLIAAGIGLGSSALAEDKSATRDGLVKLPSSGGTVQKDESSFDFSTSRGAVSYSIPLPQLPSRGGMKPSLAFVYNQSAGDSGSGLGIGWSVASSSISFNDDLGTAIKQKRSDNGDFSSHLALDGQRLISHLSNTIGGDLEYSLETSGAFVKVRYTKNPLRVNYLGKNGERLIYSFPAGFIVTSPSGQKAYFAENRDFVESDPLNPSFIVRWPMTAEINPQGEAIFYTYTKQGERSYLSKVSFAAGQSEYNFELIATRPSLVSNKASFRQLSKVLFGGVSASFRGEVQSQICLAFVGRSIDSDLFTVRAGEHCLDKAKGDLAASLDKTKTRSLNVLDQLRTIYRFGKGSSFDAANALPKLSFEYSNWNENDTITNIVYPAAALSQTNSSTSFELFDYNLDSVADLIQSTSQSLKISLGTDNLETSFTNSVSWTVERDGVKITPKIDSPSWHFVDLNGDSLMDLVEVGEGKIHVYLRKLDGKFEPATTLDFDWINPGLFESRKFRWLDINNDGLTDLIGTEIQGNNLVWKIAINQTLRTAQGFDYYFLETTQQLPFDAPLGNLLADESVLLADVNGDQLSDLVRIRPDRGGICIYENQGDIYAAPEKQLFSFADADVLSASNCEKGRFVAIDGLAHDLQTASRRVWFLDANGDGILDLVSFNSDDTQMRVWLGFGNGDFLKDPLKFSTLDAEGRPQINVQSGRERTRVADIDGDGQTELVIFQPGIVGLKPAVVIDFNRQGKNQLIKSNLLTTIENATGLRYDLRYSSSTDEMLRDHSEGLTSAPLHFPIYVVKQMVISELDPFHPGEYKDGREVKEMLYHQPIYDFTSRKLVGFRSVETITYGDEFLAQDERSQLSSYRREIFESDFRLAGKTKELYVHEFTPAEKFAEQSQDTHNLALREVTLHSMKEYSQTQGTPLAGRILFSKKFQRHLVPAAQGYDEESAYFSRDLSEESATYGSTGSASKSSKIFSQFDGFNMPTVIEEMRDAITGPNGLLIPARNTRHVLDFSESRRQLADLDIITLPSEQKTYVIENLQQEMVASTHIEYGPTGLAKKSTEEAFYDRFAVSAELQAPASRISERSFDIFGNPTTFSMNGVLLETVRFDPTGTMPIEQVNAVGHQTRMYYGSDPIEGCSSIPELAVHEGVLKAYRDPRGVCHYFSFDSFGRRTLYQRDDGYQEQYRYRFAEAGTDSRIFKQARRYAEGAVLPANESTWIQSLELYTPNGVKVASLENLELDQGVRIVSYEEHNRKKNTIRVYTPFRDTTTTLQDVFQSGLIPVTKKEGFTQTVYDALDRPVQRIYPTERTEHYTYEPWGQTQVSLYDKGQGLGTVDVIKKTVQFGKQIFAIVDERNAITRFAYDTYDNVSEVWLPGQTEARRYTYDSLDRKLQQCFPGMGCSTFQYDQVDQLSVRTNYDGTMKKISTLTFFYDVLGRLQELNDNGRLLTRNQYDRYPVELQSLAQSSAVGFLTRSQSFDGNKLYDQAKIQVYDRAGQVVLRRIDM